MTVKKTAKLTDDCSRMRTFVDSRLTRSNVSEPWWMVVAASPAVFKTVCGVGESNPLPASEERSVRHLRMWARGGDAIDNCNLSSGSLSRASLNICADFRGPSDIRSRRHLYAADP